MVLGVQKDNRQLCSAGQAMQYLSVIKVKCILV